jgi:hypothetical protein
MHRDRLQVSRVEDAVGVHGGDLHSVLAAIAIGIGVGGVGGPADELGAAVVVGVGVSRVSADQRFLFGREAVGIDVVVQAWIDGTANYGWQVMDQNEGVGPSSDAKYRTRANGTTAERPHLVVSYSP